MRIRLPKELRRNTLLHAAIQLSKESNYNNITRDGVAQRAGVSIGLVTYYFNNIETLKQHVMIEAVNKGITQIIAQGLGVKDPIAQAAPQHLKDEAIRYMTN